MGGGGGRVVGQVVGRWWWVGGGGRWNTSVKISTRRSPGTRISNSLALSLASFIFNRIYSDHRLPPPAIDSGTDPKKKICILVQTSNNQDATVAAIANWTAQNEAQQLRHFFFGAGGGAFCSCLCGPPHTRRVTCSTFTWRPYLWMLIVQPDVVSDSRLQADYAGVVIRRVDPSTALAPADTTGWEDSQSCTFRPHCWEPAR